MTGSSTGRVRTAVALVLLLGVLAGCGSEATGARRAGAPHRAASAAPATVPTAQPAPWARYDYDIVNWTQVTRGRAARAVLAAWKRLNLYVGTSYVDRQPSADLVRRLPPEYVSVVISNVTKARTGGWRYPRRGIAAVEPVHVRADRAGFGVCEWEPAFSLYRRSGAGVDPVRRQWSRFQVSMARDGGSWALRAYRPAGTCDRKAPR